MLFILGGLVIVTIVVSIVRARRAASDAHLGLMSAQWLAEQRAMHPS